jgi:hypothetical protein
MAGETNQRAQRGQRNQRQQQAEKKPAVKFLTVAEFKAKIGMAGEEASVVKNPNTGKLFVSIGGENYKCQQDINGKEEMRFLIEEDNIDEACLVNVNNVDNTVFTL